MIRVLRFYVDGFARKGYNFCGLLKSPNRQASIPRRTPYTP